MTADLTDITAPDETRRVTANRFLAALAGSPGATELLELRYRRESEHRMAQVFAPSRRARRLATRALALGRRTDVYVGCAPRTRPFGGRDAVRRAFVLWADCDGKHAVRALETFDPPPAIVIASGTGSNCHAYWPLTEPVERDELERANRRLAHALGADPISADAARILRIPGTLSHKHQPPAPVEAKRLEVERRLPAADIVGGLPDPPQPDRSDPPRMPQAVRGDDPLLAIAPEVYVRRLLGIKVPRHRKVPCPFHEDRQASLHVYETAARGWFCFGRCRRGGTIYDLAAPLYGYSLRGEDFLRLRAELRRLFGLDAA
jgi:RepB DNA-primase from phage plasmid